MRVSAIFAVGLFLVACSGKVDPVVVVDPTVNPDTAINFKVSNVTGTGAVKDPKNLPTERARAEMPLRFAK